jgi:NAD(P)-dependent dehydrogenase (short-subunit alcohol dehydrogenase family)
MESDLTGRVALVTGGSRGLGREIALALAGAGADVIVASRKLEACEAVAAEIERLDRRALARSCHIGRWEELEELADAAYEAFGRVDILVNNAGISPVYTDLASVSEELFDKTIAVNLKGPFRLAALLGTRMAAGDGGVIINVSSVAASRPRPTELPYAAAKAGLEALTAGMARAFSPSVRVNAIAAGPFETDIARHWSAEFATEVESAVALARSGEPHEIVGAALYLASEASSYTTGSVIRVDGGML